MRNEHEKWMRLAIEQAKLGIDRGQSPFGCAVVQGRELVCAAHNAVVSTPDPSAHAEILAIREAARVLGTHELRDCTLYATCEPCPMCASAIHWAKIPALCFGATIQDAAEAGFSEIALSCEELLARAEPSVNVRPGVLKEECAALFDDWLQNPGRVPY